MNIFDRLKKVFASSKYGIAMVNNYGNVTQINKRTFVLFQFNSKNDKSFFCLSGAELWEAWEALDGNGTEFKSDDKLKQIVEGIRDRISKGKKTHISGLAGIGKTRTVLESCRLLSDDERNRIIYIPKFDNKTVELLRMLKKDKKQIIVIDDCEKKYLNEIKRAITHSDITLVTIDYDSYDNDDELKFNEASDEIISAIVKQKSPRLDQHVQSAIVKASGGFPRFAEHITDEVEKSILRGDVAQLGQFNGDHIYRILLRGRDGRYDQNQVNILMVISLFTKIGYDPTVATPDLVRGGNKYMSDPTEMNSIIEVFGLDRDRVFEVYGEFYNRKIIQRKGLSISVQPFPLAIHLAKEWKSKTDPVTVRNKFDSLTIPLKERFMQRMKFLEDVRNFAEFFIGGKDVPFSNAELLNSPSNELFGELAEMAPDLAMDSLEYAFEGWTAEDFKDKLISNRRKIVWILEKIMFNKDLYERAGVFLFRLASGENESWGNNATGILVQTMQIFLSPTEASLEQRINLLYSLKPTSGHDIDIVLKMIDKGLHNDGHYSCAAGAERQGARTLEYYSPKKWDEVKEYFFKLTDVLVDISKYDDKELRKEVLKIINRNINPIMMDMLFDNYEPMVSQLLSEFQDMIPTFLSNSRSHNGEGFEKLEKYKGSLMLKSDDDLDSKFNLYIVPNEYEVGVFMSADDDIKFEKIRPLVKQKVEEIADGYLANLDRLYASLEMFIDRDTWNILYFASRIGAKIDDCQKFVNTLLDMHRTGGYNNFSLLAIAMHEIWKRDSIYVDAVLGKLLNDDFWLSKQEIIRFVGTVHDGFLESDLDSILKLVAAEKITPWQLKVGGLSIRLKDSVPPNKIVSFLYELYRILGSKSCDFIMETISYYKFKDAVLPEEFEPLVIDLLKNPKNIADMFNDDTSGYNVSEVIRKIRVSDEYVVDIFESFKEATNCDERYRLDNHGYVGSIIKYLIEGHPNTLVPHILNAMSKEKSRWSARWLSLLGGMGNGSIGSSSSLFSPGLDCRVIKYLDSAKKTSRFNTRNNIIELVNLLHQDDEKIEWSPLIGYLIDTAETKDDLGRINAKICNYFWSGKTSNYYKQYLPLFEELSTSSSKPLLRSWAKETLDWLNKNIKQEINREEELGY